LLTERFVSLDKLQEIKSIENADVGMWVEKVREILGPKAKMLVEEYT
jgi:hypothetical protein